MPDNEPERLIRFATRHRVELKVVEVVGLVAMLTLLAAIAVPTRVGRTVWTRCDDARGDIATLCKALEIFKQEKGSYPGTLEELIMSDVTYFKASDVPLDPWGNPYAYRFPGQHVKAGYDLISYGPDGVEGGGDDITSWNLRRQADSN